MWPKKARLAICRRLRGCSVRKVLAERIDVNRTCGDVYVGIIPLNMGVLNTHQQWFLGTKWPFISIPYPELRLSYQHLMEIYCDETLVRSHNHLANGEITGVKSFVVA